MKSCPYFKECGGCNHLDIPYDVELENKRQNVSKLFKSIGYAKNINILGAKDPYYYRNKVMMAFKLSKTKHVVSGIYEEYSHHIIPVEDCLIQQEPINNVLKSVNRAMSKNHILPAGYGGVVKHVLVRYGVNSKEILVAIVTEGEVWPGRANFLKDLLKLSPEITTVVQNIQSRDTVIVMGEKQRVLFGKGFINDTLCGLTFKISPRSFYQINPRQTEVLYNTALQMANLKDTDVILDSYSGIGTIGMVASKKVKHVISVENNADAVKDARLNASLNGIKNIDIFEADSTKFIEQMATEKNSVDCVILDPPRTGTTKEFINALSSLKVKKVIYVSCNPETQVRDLKEFIKHGYQINDVCAVDQFPRTLHVENIACLELKK